MRNRKEYMRDYYQRKKDAANLGMSLVKPPPSHVTTTFKPPFDHVLANHPEPLRDNGLNGLNTVKTGSKPVQSYVIGGILVAFILANTGFLINEQIRYYMLKGYSLPYALFVSFLCESAVILLSYLGATFKGGKSFGVYFSLTLTIGCILAVIFLGVDRTQSEEVKNSEIASLMRSEIASLREQLPERPKIAPKLLKKEEELRTFLQTKNVSIGSFETFVLASIRILSLLWNIVFASLLAGLFRRKDYVAGVGV